MIQPDKHGFFGTFGGAFVPELLRSNLRELTETFESARGDRSFDREFTALLKDYVGRPTPLYYAGRLSEHVGCRVWLKREDLNHTGAHKINNALGQILLAQRMGKTRIIAETGAGQHGVATATACALKGLKCVVYMGAKDMERQAPNVARMRMLGAGVVSVKKGSQTLKDATNEAIRDWINNPLDTHYIIGSAVGPHPYPSIVAYLQSIISQEIREQCGQFPDGKASAVIACLGGGSNAIGSFYHLLDDDVRLITAEAAGKGIESGATAATSFVGSPGILHGSMTLLMQTPDGQVVEPYSISAGLDYPGIGPLCAHLIDTGRVESMAVTDDEALEAAFWLTKLEGIIPALESAHALAVLHKMAFEESDNVIVNLSGRGDKDMAAYISHHTKSKGDAQGRMIPPLSSLAFGLPLPAFAQLRPARLAKPACRSLGAGREGIEGWSSRGEDEAETSAFCRAPRRNVFDKKERDLLSIFIPAGFPDPESCKEALIALGDTDVDFIELGMPYSDPLADGLVIQDANQRALRNGITLEGYFETIRDVRSSVACPIFFMGYFNNVLQYGIERFLENCHNCGVDSLIIPDLPPEIYERRYASLFEKHDLGINFMVCPTSDQNSIEMADRMSHQFIYQVSHSAITGEGVKGNHFNTEFFERMVAMPLNKRRIIGFGIKTHPDFKLACQYSAGGIVGSAFLEVLQGPGSVEKKVQDFVKVVRGR